jgi:hypothetical protein
MTEGSCTFEIVLADEEPDLRLCIECYVDLLGTGGSARLPDPGGYAIRRIYVRHSWIDTVEIPLSGPDREGADAFARRVVPELGSEGPNRAAPDAQRSRATPARRTPDFRTRPRAIGAHRLPQRVGASTTRSQR